MKRWSQGAWRPVVAACVVGLAPSTAFAWKGWWDHDKNVCYLRDEDHHDDHDWLWDLFHKWDKDKDRKIQVDCDYLCDGGCVKDAETWCAELSAGGEWPIPEWENDGRCGESWLDLICSTSTDRFHALARQYATALLNHANGSCVTDTLVGHAWEALEVLRGCKVTRWEIPDANRLIVILGSYNTGRIGPGTCKERRKRCDWWDITDWLDPECLHEWFDHDWLTCKDPKHYWH